MVQKKLTIIAFIIITVTLVSPIKRLQLCKYNDIQIQSQWDEVRQQLTDVQQLIITYSGLSQRSLFKILMEQMPKLRILTFTRYNLDPMVAYTSNIKTYQYLTPKLVKSIFNSPYFCQLKEIHLINTNIDDRQLQFIDNMEMINKTCNLQKLSLGLNFISSKGFKRLARLPIQPLTYLSINNNLLIERDAVDALISLTCPSQVEFIDISQTNIKREDFIRLFRSLDTSNLKYLNISKINIHQYVKYSEGFNLTAYQQLAKLQFPKLQVLQMNDLSLDASILYLFRKWKLPKLAKLSITQNFIDDQALQYWINKDNMPNLKCLTIFNNQITGRGLKHIISQLPLITELNIGNNLISQEDLVALKQLKLQKLILKLLKINSIKMRQVFNQLNTSSLNFLSLSRNSELTDIFEYLPWQKLLNMQSLFLSNCNFYESIDLMLNANRTLLPRLKSLYIDESGKDRKVIEKFITEVEILFPELTFVNLIQNSIRSINFSKLQIQKVKKELFFQLGYVNFKRQGNKIQLLEISNFASIIKYSSSIDLHQYFENQIIYTFIEKNVKEIPQSVINSVVKEMVDIFDISQLHILVIRNMAEFRIFQKWIQKIGIKKLSLSTLKLSKFALKISVLNMFLSNLEMPLLRSLKFQLNITSEESDFEDLTHNMNRFNCLVDLDIKLTYNKTLNRQKDYNTFFNQLKYPFLRLLDLSQNYLQVEEISGMIYNHSPSIRYLNLKENFLQYTLIQLLIQNQVTLFFLDLSLISLSLEEFAKLGRLTTSFFEQFSANKCELTDQHIISFVQENRQHRQFLFPKIQYISLNENDIGDIGTRKLFQHGLFDLLGIRIQRSMNPHFVNILLLYTTDILEIVAEDIQIYALDQSISPISTRRILNIALKTSSFTVQDFTILFSLKFSKLQLIQLRFKNLFHCQLLQQLLNVCTNTQNIYLILQNQKPGLNTNCFPSYNDSFRTSINSIAVHESTYTSYIPSFIEFILRSSKMLKYIVIDGLRLPPYIFWNIKAEQISSIRILMLKDSYLDDRGFSIFAQTPLKYLQMLFLSNTLVTIDSLKLLAGKTLGSLLQLDLSLLPLGNEGLKLLSQIKAQNLNKLLIKSCEISNIDLLNNLYFPKLEQISISYNNINCKQFINFLQNINKSALPTLSKIAAKGFDLSFTQYNKIQQLAQLHHLVIQVQHPKYIQVRNQAKY